MSDALQALIGAELRREVPPPVRALAEQLAQRAEGAAVAVLFYGSNLRDACLDGVLDFYIVLDRVNAWPGSRLAALANGVLPPNVGYCEEQLDGHALRAKYALISLSQFRRGVSHDALDTTLWARFSQPCCVAWVRSEVDLDAAVEVVSQAVTTAARWAAELGPESGEALAYWRALFASTYAAELRVERGGRGHDLVARDADRYVRLLPAAWSAAGIGFAASGLATVAPEISQSERKLATRQWALRRRLGKFLNLARLLKAAFTLDGAVE